MTPFYDPMIAKIVVWGEDRRAALTQLRRALAETAVLGVATNRDFLGRVAAHPEFAAGAIDTGFIERHRPELIPEPSPAPDAALAMATLSRLIARESSSRQAAECSGDPYSPWARIDGWRLNGVGHQELVFRDGAQEHRITAIARASDWLLQIGDQPVAATGDYRADGHFSLTLDGVRREVTVLDHGSETAVFLDGASWRLIEIDPLAASAGEDPMAGRLTAPMPGRVRQLMIEIGSTVRRGQPLMVIEAMKMEHTIAAPADGVIEAVHFAVGDQVEEGAELIALASQPQQHD